MASRSSRVLTILLITAIVLITAIYTRGEIYTPPDEDRQIAQLKLEKLRDTWNLVSLEEKEDLVKRGLTKDNRPALKEAVKAKGLYMTGRAFHIEDMFTRLLNLIDKTELNAVVIDVKDDNGAIIAPFELTQLQEVNPPIHKGSSVEDNMYLLYLKDIYPIARIVVFKDPALAENKPELAIRRTDGSLWRDRKGLAWVDPHNKEVWKYAVDIAKEAAKLGFREIQYDYVRFPTDGDVKYAVYPYATGQAKEDVIADFLSYAKNELEPYNVFLSADVFGLTTLTIDDMGMGQKFEKIMEHVDYICPMVYPSHYGRGNYGFENPNAHPFDVVKKALEDGLKKVGSKEVIIRPWLQDFSLGTPKYGASEVRAQIEATYAAQLEEWLLWNAGNNYTSGALAE